MAEPNGVDHGLPEPDDWLEWVPAEVQEAMRKPRFRRLTPDERIRRHGQEVPAAYLRPKRFARKGGEHGAAATPTIVIAPPEPESAPGREEAPERPPAASTAPQPAIDERLARRLEEVEGVVDQAARSVTRRAERVRSMLADTLGAAGGDLPS